MSSYWKSGNAFIWLTVLATSISMLMVTGLVLLILANGLGIFWPMRLAEITLQDGTRLLGEVWDREAMPQAESAEPQQRWRLKIGNRDFYGLDFRWIEQAGIENIAYPDSAIVLERRAWGNFFGYVTKITVDDETQVEGAAATAAVLPDYLDQTAEIYDRIRHLEKEVIGDVNYEIEQRRLTIRKLEMTAGDRTAERVAALEQEIAALEQQYEMHERELEALYRRGRAWQLTLETADGRTKELSLLEVVRTFQPNGMSWIARSRVYASRLWEFLADEPREANMEGGVFPAIFGTVLLVIIMSIAVVPFGVLSAIYMHEYAKKGPLLQTVRIAVNNLAGVPSIVFGIFGLGFFIYTVGGTIDQLFYSEVLPNPTYGTGGILWASLTLALLTVPVVIVATEEGLAAVPRAIREGSLALGATKFETIWRIVLPSASPAILTGLILAVARAAGEVAPLMITGVVKLAPSLPLDEHWPLLHLDRKFMHLGFHIYDVGFQSPNVEAALPMVYMTTLLLILIVLGLNLTAILLRNRLHKRFSVGQF